MKKFKKIAYIALILIGIGLLPLLCLKGWASYLLWQTERVKTPEGLNRWEETVRRSTTYPAGENLLKRPLWEGYLKDKIAFFRQVNERSNAEFSTQTSFYTYEEAYGFLFSEDIIPDGVVALPQSTNPLFIWVRDGRLENFEDLLKPPSKDAQDKSPSLLEKLREIPSIKISESVTPRHKQEMKRKIDLMSEILQRYDTAESTLSEEQKTAAILLDYANSGFESLLAELKKDFKECSYYTLPLETFLKCGGREPDYIYDPLSDYMDLFGELAHSAALKAQWYAILGEKEKCLSELDSLLDLVSLKPCNAISVDSVMRINMITNTTDAIQKIIQKNIAGEEDLRLIQERLSRFNLFEDLESNMDEEQFFFERVFGYMTRKYEGEHATHIRFPLRLLVRMSGLADFNKAICRELVWKYQDALDPEAQRVDYDAWEKARQMRDEKTKGFLSFMTRMFSASFPLKGFQRGQSIIDTAVLACALERYRLKEGSFPEKLEVLIPEYLPQMPPGSGPPALLSYELNEEGYELKANRLPELPPEFSVEVVWKRSRE